MATVSGDLIAEIDQRHYERIKAGVAELDLEQLVEIVACCVLQTRATAHSMVRDGELSVRDPMLNCATATHAAVSELLLRLAPKELGKAPNELFPDDGKDDGDV
jgi:hypothetical protein